MLVTNLSVVLFTEPPDNGVNGFRTVCNKRGITSGNSYIVLGFIGMQEEIVLVNDSGLVVRVPYSEQYFLEV